MIQQETNYIMKIVLFGEDIFSAVVLKSLLTEGYVVPLVICPYRKGDNNYKSIKKITDEHEILFLREHNVNSESVKAHLLEIKPDLILTVHIKRILKDFIFSLAYYGAINVHPSLLPKYRGLSPLRQALLHGDLETAVTIHFIEDEIDTGDIIMQERVPISENDYISDLQFKIMAIYKKIFIKAIELIKDKSYKAIKQDHSNASYYGMLKDVDRKIDLNKSKKEVYNHIRAFSMPYKGAFYDDYVIWRAFFPSVQTEELLRKRHQNIGFYFDSEEEKLVIRLKDGILLSDDFKIINKTNL